MARMTVFLITVACFLALVDPAPARNSADNVGVTERGEKLEARERRDRLIDRLREHVADSPQRASKRARAAAVSGHAIVPEQTVTGHGDFLGLAVTPDNQFVVWIPYEQPNAIRLLRAGDGTVVWAVEAYQWITTAVAVTPDGRYILSGGDDGVTDYSYRLKLWRASDGALVRTFDVEHTGSITSLAVSPDGQYAASGGDDGSVKLWRVADGSLVRTIHGHAGKVRTVAFTADGRRLVSGSDDGNVIAWQLDAGGQTAKPASTRRIRIPLRKTARAAQEPIHVGDMVSGFISLDPYFDVYTLTLAQEQSLLFAMSAISGNLDPFLEIHDANDQYIAGDDDGGAGLNSRLDITLPAGTYLVYAASAYAAGVGGTSVTTGGYRLLLMNASSLVPDASVGGEITDNQTDAGYTLTLTDSLAVIVTLNATSGDLDPLLWIKNEAGTTLAINDDAGDGLNSFIGIALGAGVYTLHVSRASTSSSGGFRLNVQDASGALVMAQSSGVRSFAITPDDAYLVSGGVRSDDAFVWSLADGSLVGTLPGNGKGVSAVAAFPSGAFVLTGGGDGSVRMWRTADWGLERTFAKVHTYDVEWMAVGLGGDVILSGSWGVVKALEVSSGRIVLEIGRGHMFDAIIAPDGRFVVTGSADGRIRKWNRRTGELLAASTLRHDDWVISLAASPDGRYIASAGDFLLDYTAALWKANDLSLIETFPHEEFERINALAVTPDDKFLVTGTNLPAVRVWRVSDGALVRTITGHSGAVTGVAVSADGQWIVSSSEDGTAKVWRFSDGSLARTLAGHAGKVTGIAISPDGQWVATSSEDATARIWSLSDGSLVRTLTGHVGSVTSIAFSPDGEWIITGGADRSVRVWSRTDPTLVSVLADQHKSDVRGVGMDADGRYLVSESDDQTVRSRIVEPPMGRIAAATLSVDPQPGLPVRVRIRGTLHGATSATLALTVDSTLLVPDSDFVRSDAFAGKTNAQSSVAVNGSALTVSLSADDPISLDEDVLAELGFRLGASAVPGARVPLRWVAAQTLVNGAPVGLSDGVFTVPVPRDTRISAFSPEGGNAGATTELTIRGANFTGASALALVPDVGQPFAIAAFLVVNDGFMRAVVPPSVPPGTYRIRITTPKGAGTSAGTFNVAPAGQDTRPPTRISDLRVDSTTATSLLVRWTAPADTTSGGSVRPAAAYDLRYTAAALDSAAFQTLSRVPLPRPRAPGQTESVWIAPLASGRIYFIGVVSTDSAGNRSRLSNLAHGITREDTQPPKIVKQAVTAAGDKEITVAVETDEPAQANIAVFAAFGGGQDTLRAVDGTLAAIHRLTVTGLTPATFYGYSLTLRDASGNATTTEPRAVQTLTRPDLLPPSFSRPPFVANRADNSLTLGWTANEPVTAVVRYGIGTAYSDSLVITERNTTHIAEIGGLAQLTTYHVQVSLYDQSGNGPVTSDDIVSRTLREPDLSPPQFVNAPAVIAKSVDRATILWATDEPATAVVEYGTTEQYGRAVELREPNTEQSAALTNLLADTRYHYRVRVRDEAQTESVSQDRLFRTPAGPDTQPPVILESPNVIPETDRARIRFRTDEPALSTVHFGTSQGGLSRAVGSFQLVTDHEILLANLSSGTRYYYLLTTFDAAGNAPILRLRSFKTSGAPDTLSPVIVAGPTIPYTGDDRVVFQWRTDEITTGEVWYQADGDSVAANVVDPALDWEHRVTVTNLAPGEHYQFVIVARDAAGNTSTFPETSPIVITNGGGPGKIAGGRSGSFTTAVAPDVQSPVIVGGPVVVGRTARTLTVEWNTDEVATSTIRYRATSPGVPGRPAQGAFDDEVESGDFTTAHQVTLTNLKPGRTYEFQAFSTDPANNEPAVSRIAVAATATEVDITPPRIVERPVISATDTRAIIRWATDEIADSEVSYWTADDEPTTVTIGERGIRHAVVLTNLKSGTTYHCVVRSADLNDNGPTEVGGLVFTTEPAADVLPPNISEVRVNALGNVSAKVAWRTDEPASSQVEFGETTALGRSASSGDNVDEHALSLTNLRPATTYHYRVTSVDLSGISVAGNVGTFTTLASADTVAPPAPSLVEADAGDRAVRIRWRSVAANDLAGYHVYRSVGDGSEAAVATFVRDTAYADLGLVNGTSYRYRVAAVDEFGNVGPRSGPAATVTPDPAGVPGAPTALTPGGRERVALRPMLTAANATPAPVRPSAELSYSFVIARDSALSDVVATSRLVPENITGTTSWQVRIELVHDSTYFWGVAANDGVFTGPLSASQAFIADSTKHVVVAVDLADFAAVGGVGAVTVRWAGANPDDRFRVLRAEAERGPFVLVGRKALSGETKYVFRDVRVAPGRTYYYKLERTFPGGWVRRYGPLSAAAASPERFALRGVAPNPFNPVTTITFAVARPEPMKLVVYDALGQRIRTLVNAALAPGVHRVTWNGRDDLRREVASGVYFVKMQAPGYERTMRITMVR